MHRKGRPHPLGTLIHKVMEVSALPGMNSHNTDEMLQADADETTYAGYDAYGALPPTAATDVYDLPTESPRSPYLTIFSPRLKTIYQLDLHQLSQLLNSAQDKTDQLLTVINKFNTELDDVYFSTQEATYPQFIEFLIKLNTVSQQLGEAIAQEIFRNLMAQALSNIRLTSFVTPELTALYGFLKEQTIITDKATIISLLRNLSIQSINNFHDIIPFYRTSSILNDLQEIIESNLRDILVRIKISEVDAGTLIGMLRDKDDLKQIVRESVDPERRELSMPPDPGTSPQIHSIATI